MSYFKYPFKKSFRPKLLYDFIVKKTVIICEKKIFLLLYVGCCLHGMFDEILLFCTLFMALMTIKSLKLVKEMDHPGVFSLTVCKKIKNQNKKLGIGNLLTANPGVCFSFWRKPSQTQHWNVESRNLDLRGRVSDNIFNF